MITLDESTLIAYVDGELDLDTAREVEADLARDDDARAYVEHLRALAALTRVAFNDVVHEPVPQRLKDAAMGRTLNADEDASGGTVVDFAAQTRFAGAKRALPHGFAAAAAVVGLVLGLGGGFVFSEQSADKALQLAALNLQQDRTAMNQALNQALEVKMSGEALTWDNPDSGRSAAFTPVRTYQNDKGQFCREYRKDVSVEGDTQSTFGLACREGDGQWKTRYLILEDGAGENL